MDKHLLQMTELKLRCISLFFKQINQFNSTLKIRTFDQRNDGNHFGEESEWHHNEAKDIPLISGTNNYRISELFYSLILNLFFLISISNPIDSKTYYNYRNSSEYSIDSFMYSFELKFSILL